MVTEQEQAKIAELMAISSRIEKGDMTSVTILGKTFKLSDIKRKITNKIIDLQVAIDYNDKLSRKKKLRLIQVFDVRVCSYLMLNLWSFIPFLHTIHWRYLEAKYTSETFYGIIEAGLSNPEFVFFSKCSIQLRNLAASRTQMIKTEQK